MSDDLPSWAQGLTAETGPPLEFDETPPHDEPRANGKTRARPTLDYILADDIKLEIDQPGIVDGLIGLTGMTVIYGESTAGKSFVTVDLACTIAASSLATWRGFDVGQGVVVYIAAEAPKSIERRVWAWMRHHGVEHLPVAVVRSPVDLLNGDATAIIELLAQLRNRLGPIAMVVIDTLARAMVGNENAPDDMGGFVNACGQIGAEAETHVLIVHHCGKEAARGARGHSSLRAATDVEIEVLKGADDDATRSIRIAKNREGEEGPLLGFKLEKVELGENKKGRLVTTCVAVEAEAPAGSSSKQRKLGGNQKIVLEALLAAITDRAEEPPLATDIPRGARGVSVDRWQETASRYLPQPEDKRKCEAFKRAVLSLVASGFVKHAGGFAWLP